MKFFAVFAALVSMAVAFPASTTLNLHELSEAIQNPATNPALLPFLEDALNQLMLAIVSGEPISSVTLPLPAIIPGAVPEAASTDAAAASSPLVQIIINVKQEEQSVVADGPAPVPVPVATLPVATLPVVTLPNPVLVVEQPEPVLVVEGPTPEFNPIDVIAVSAPEVNPIDLLHPVPAGAQQIQDIVGPIV